MQKNSFEFKKHYKTPSSLPIFISYFKKNIKRFAFFRKKYYNINTTFLFKLKKRMMKGESIIILKKGIGCKNKIKRAEKSELRWHRAIWRP